MRIDRRTMLFGAACAATIGGSPAHSATGVRQLDLFRGGDRIGDKQISVIRDGDVVDVTTRIRINVKLLGVSAYSYSLQSQERWNRGSLVTLSSKSNDNGTPGFARAERSGNTLRVEGSKFSGDVGGNPGTTSYWTPALLKRSVWINTQDGRPMNVAARDLGAVSFPGSQGSVNARRWKIGGDLDGLELFYDANGEWIGTEFPARGKTARFVTSVRGGALTPLWVNA